MKEQEIRNIIEDIAVTREDFSTYLKPTEFELKKMRRCGDCEYNKPFTLAFNDGTKHHTRFCDKNDHYVQNNSIQLTCWFNKQYLLKNTFRNRFILKYRKWKKK
jgi:hypothetical protein